MNNERTEIIEKARARRRRREEGKSAKNASRKGKAVSAATETTLAGKVVDSAQGTAAQIGAFVKSTARKITGGGG